MSLLKQLLILISTLILLVLSTNFILSVENIRSYLEDEAQVHVQDTATSLGLSLSPYMVDENDPVIETMMSAIFDMGYYQEISLSNIEGKVLVVLKNTSSYEGVPRWFVENLPMKTATAETEISSGWSIAGKLMVTASPGFAYMKLYKQVESSFYFSLVVLLASFALLFLVLRITLSSLKKISQTALKIADGHFEKISPMPWTTEVAQVANSMNIMSGKIGGVIAGLNSKLQQIGNKLELDDLTGLRKKTSFERDFEEVLSEGKGAYFFTIKVDALSHMVKELTSPEVDAFLKEFGELLQELSQSSGQMDITAYRFFGGEFSLLVTVTEGKEIKKLAQQLTKQIDRISKQYQQEDIAHVGIIPFSELNAISGVLLAADEAYEQARIIGKNSCFIKEKIGEAKDIAVWKRLVFNVIENDLYTLSMLGKVERFDSGEVLLEDAFAEVFDETAEKVSIATFISIAEKFVKIVDLDKGVTQKALEYIKANNVQHLVTVSLSTRTIKNSDFRTWLEAFYKENQPQATKLMFSFSAYAVAKEIAAYQEFMAFIHQLGGKVIVKRFDTQSMSPEVLTQLKPDYIRIARDTSDGISKSAEKRLFVETVKEIGELSNITIVTESVVGQDDYECIKGLGVIGTSR